MKIENLVKTGEGTYISAIPLRSDIEKMYELFSDLEVPFDLDTFMYEAHMTIVYSRSKSIDPTMVNQQDDIIGIVVGLEFWDGHDGDGYAVIRIISDDSVRLHNHIVDIGAEHSFKDYNPHMTLCDKVNKLSNHADIIEWIASTNEYLKKNPFVIHFDVIRIEDCNQH